MHPLNFPQYEFDIQGDPNHETIFDPLRRKHVRLTPEEWVRQHLIQFLVHDQGFPAGRTAIESGFTHKSVFHRADLIVYDRTGTPLLMAECKAPEVKLNQAVFDQIARYNTSLQASYLLVTNGLTHYCYAIDREAHTYRFLDKLPRYEEL
ncbi:MAG: type I restriction enzyme HsdR N-terminal domain-containing protein [bacterium]|nr:type I restriction enzyme HsdR N-terminal domain-containing protein [bacterium]